MTEGYFIRKRKTAFFACLLILTFFLLVNIQSVSFAVKEGATLAFTLILPALFPFLILSTLLSESFPLENKRKHGCISRVFRLPSASALPLLLGLLSGFPIGAKAVGKLYERGILRKEEAERLLLFVNNTGPAFLFGGVGALFGDIKVGVFLFVIQAVSSTLFGIVLGLGKPIPTSTVSYQKDSRSLSLVNAVKESVTSALQITGFIILFQVILTVFRIIIPNSGILIFLSCILEISSAVSAIAEMSHLSLGVCMPLLGFAVSFSGLSVYMQTAAVLDKSGLSMRFYLPGKLFQGVLSAVLAGIFAPIFL